MKRYFTTLLTVLFLFTGVAAHGDVAYEPPQSDFYDTHRAECTRVERDYYTNGTKGYIALRKEPGGAIIAYITNGEELEVFCTYEGWGMIPTYNGAEQEVPGWVEMSELYLIYDEQSFQEEYADEIFQREERLTLPEEIAEFYIYNYPGASSPYLHTRGAKDLEFGTLYTDPEGRIWGAIGYYMGIRDSWVCLSDPTHIIAPFGGDPNLAQFEQKEEQEVSGTTEEGLQEVLPDHLTPDTEDVYNQAEEPPARLPMDPLLPIAIGLVILAVAGAVIPILVCYKKKEK